MSSEQRTDDVARYGPWAWICGLLFAAALIVFMFALADGFS